MKDPGVVGVLMALALVLSVSIYKKYGGERGRSCQYSGQQALVAVLVDAIVANRQHEVDFSGSLNKRRQRREAGRYQPVPPLDSATCSTILPTENDASQPALSNGQHQMGQLLLGL